MPPAGMKWEEGHRHVRCFVVMRLVVNEENRRIDLFVGDQAITTEKFNARKNWDLYSTWKQQIVTEDCLSRDRQLSMKIRLTNDPKQNADEVQRRLCRERMTGIILIITTCCKPSRAAWWIPIPVLSINVGAWPAIVAGIRLLHLLVVLRWIEKCTVSTWVRVVTNRLKARAGTVLWTYVITIVWVRTSA